MEARCNFCNAIIDLNKEFTSEQIKRNYEAKRMVEKMGLKLPNIKNYYCDCGGHITLMKINNTWKVVSSSKDGK